MCVVCVWNVVALSYKTVSRLHWIAQLEEIRSPYRKHIRHIRHFAESFPSEKRNRKIQFNIP